MNLRYLRAPHRTSVKLEPEFWEAIDLIARKAGRLWHEWAVFALDDRPEESGAASWLRVQCFKQAMKEKL